MAGLSDLADDERTARMVLSMLVEPNDPVTGRVMNGLGAMETLRLAERDGAVVGLSAVGAQVWRDHFDAPAAKDIAARLDQAQQSGIQVLVPGDANWPVALNDLGDLAPYVLWTRGASSFLARPLQDFVTITGSRASTSYGDHVARELAASTAADERVVVAGGAYGIEGAAHQAALAAGGDTIAILANGVDRPYPAGHCDLLERVADVGLLVSEVPPGTVPTRHRFIARGRLMAALASTTVIVEAAGRSGSLEVAQHAFELGRKVGAVPGPVTSAASKGPHRLLREGTASLIADSVDLARLVERGNARQVSAPRTQVDADRVRPATPEPTGSVPAGSELTFEVFKSPVAGDLKHDQNGELTDTAWTQAEVDALNGEAVCTMENLAGRTEPIAVTAGPHSGERYTSPGVQVDRAGTYWWIESLLHRDPESGAETLIISGTCGLLLLAAVMVGVAGGESRVGPNAASQERCPVGGIASTCCFEQCGHEAPRRGAARNCQILWLG